MIYMGRLHQRSLRLVTALTRHMQPDAFNLILAQYLVSDTRSLACLSSRLQCHGHRITRFCEHKHLMWHGHYRLSETGRQGVVGYDHLG
jgi:hypothetical protein